MTYLTMIVHLLFAPKAASHPHLPVISFKAAPPHRSVFYLFFVNYLQKSDPKAQKSSSDIYLIQAWIKGLGLLTSSQVLSSLQQINHVHRQHIYSRQAPFIKEEMIHCRIIRGFFGTEGLSWYSSDFLLRLPALFSWKRIFL